MPVFRLARSSQYVCNSLYQNKIVPNDNQLLADPKSLGDIPSIAKNSVLTFGFLRKPALSITRADAAARVNV